MEKRVAPVRISEKAKELGLEPYLLELDVDGLTIVPPEVHGVDLKQIDTIAEFLLEEIERMTGSPFSLTNGPANKLQLLDAPEHDPELSGLATKTQEIALFVIQQLACKHRMFRDLAVNPVAVELLRHMIGQDDTRFSSFNCLVKWQGEWGYGPTLGMHADQTQNPLPWGSTALNANTNWCLTEYTKADGCLTYVPGSHRFGYRPEFPLAVDLAVPVETAKGSLLVFHGATWHGAYPKVKPGMRLTIANYARHYSVAPQEYIVSTITPELARDCNDSELFLELGGFNDSFPYFKQNQPVPRVVPSDK